MTGLTPVPSETTFVAARDHFVQTLVWLEGGEAAALTHAELEDHLVCDARELYRLLVQDHLDVRADREARLDRVTDVDEIDRPATEAGHTRTLMTVFGTVTVTRKAYRRRGHPNIHPGDAALNLPTEKHSHGVRRLTAVEATRGSYDAARDAIIRVTGQELGKRQLEELTVRAAVDFDDFYATRPPQPADDADVLVISADAKGIVMRPDALRPATAKAAETATPKLATRLSKGEKRNRKRMATVGAVYDLTPQPRTAADIISSGPRDGPVRPKPANKWLTASVVDDAADVIAQIFDQAQRRDPGHTRTWVALVDGNRHQIDQITAQAAARGVDIAIVLA